MAEGRSIEDTDSLRIEALFIVFILLTLLFEKLLHYLDHNLKGRTRKGIRHAVHYIEQELLALGFISLLLIVFEEHLLEICVKNDNYKSKKKDYGYDESAKDDSHRKLMTRTLLAGDEGDGDCSAGDEPFWSANTIHQTHILIFLVAVMHVVYATVSILLCLWRMRGWRKYENQPDHALKQLRNRRLMYGTNASEYWFWSFWAQFSPGVDESLYLSMRYLFIQRMEFSDDFDFLSFVTNSLVEEYAMVAGTDWLMWVIAAIWIVVPQFLLITTIIAVLIVLTAGTKLELVGVKLSQMAYLAYGDRSTAEIKSIVAPSTIIKKSVINVAQRFNRGSATPSPSQQPPSLAAQSISVFGRTETGKQDLVRRVHSAEGNFTMEAPAQTAHTSEQTAPTRRVQISEIVHDTGPPVEHPNTVDGESPRQRQSLLSCCSYPKNASMLKSFSKNYSLPDSSSLFWFKRPQLILRALRFVYFETAMAIAVVLFDWWQDSTFIIEKTHIFGNNENLSMVILIGIGIVCLLHTSFLMLPTYALTMVAGSHCPETVLDMAKKMKIETQRVTRIESLEDKSLTSQINTLDSSLKAEPTGEGSDESSRALKKKQVSALVGEMYKGQQHRLSIQLKHAASLKEYLDEQQGGKEAVEQGNEAAKEGSDGKPSSSGSNGEANEEVGINQLFGSFDQFLVRLQEAQLVIKRMSPNAEFGFDCSTGSYDGRQSTKFDNAAINLVWDLSASDSDRIGDHG